jgi:hypothetical protein
VIIGAYRISHFSEAAASTKFLLIEKLFKLGMSKKRPGFQAGANLVALDDPRTWEQVERHGEEVISSIPHLKEYQRALEEFGTTKECFTKAELDKIVLWKHTVGKNRVYNRKYLAANTDEAVREHSRAAITLAHSISVADCLGADGALTAAGKKSIQEVVACLDKLKGVGPATASAAMVLVRPDIFCYLYDEVIDCFESKRDYKISNYLRVNSRCLQIARSLGGDWTTSRVAKTIWIASRFLAIRGEDLSNYQNEPKNEENEDAEKDEKEDDEEEGDGNEDDDAAEEDEGDDKQPETKRQKNS